MKSGEVEFVLIFESSERIESRESTSAVIEIGEKSPIEFGGTNNCYCSSMKAKGEESEACEVEKNRNLKKSSNYFVLVYYITRNTL